MADADLVDGWIQGHLTGTLAAADAERLRAWLGEDPGHRRRFMRAVRFHEELIQVATEQARRRAPDNLVAGPGVGRSARRRRLAPSVRPRPQHWLLAAAALLALAVLGVWWRSGSGPAQPPIAELIAGEALADDGAILGAGAGIRNGTGLTMRSAGAVAWPDGSRIDLDKDSRLLGTANGATLHAGRLVADIRPHAAERPFAIETPDAAIVVVGTRFSVELVQGGTAVDVRQGTVRVTARSGETRALGPGETVFAGPAGLRGRTLLVDAQAASAGTSFATVLAALAAARPGDTVLLQSGRHQLEAKAGRPGLQVSVSGTPGAPVGLRGKPGAELVCDAWNALQLEDVAWLDIRGLRLTYQGSERSGMSGNGIHILRSKHISIRDCDIIGFGGDGVIAHESDNVLIEGNRITGCGGGRLGTMGGVTVHTQAGQTEHGIRIIGNRILQSTVNSPNHNAPERWTGGHGILVYASEEMLAPHRVLIADNVIAASGGSGISVYRASGIDLQRNIIHWSGRHPKHAGGEVHIAGRQCTAIANLIVPADGRPAWLLGESLQREQNQVWERDGTPRPGVLTGERMAASPYLAPAADEALRTDFRLRPGITAGPRP